MKNALIIIDAQNDFCDPEGALFVPGSVEDCQRLSKWIISNIENIGYMVVTRDEHHINNIGLPNFWCDANGNPPPPFTIITKDDISNGTWRVRFESDLVNLKEPNYIWPKHCLQGSVGSNIVPEVKNAISTWEEINGKNFKMVTKGESRFTHEYGASFSEAVIEELVRYQNIYISGQARNFCVATTVSLLLERAVHLDSKIVILEDCMSNVPGFENVADGIWDEARKAGVRFSTTEKEKLIA